MDTTARDLAALRAWAGEGWDVAAQPWTWPANWSTRDRARDVLAELEAAAT